MITTSQEKTLEDVAFGRIGDASSFHVPSGQKLDLHHLHSAGLIRFKTTFSRNEPFLTDAGRDYLRGLTP